MSDRTHDPSRLCAASAASDHGGCAQTDGSWADKAKQSEADYGVGGYSPKVLLHTTSFVGLAVADTLQFGITF